MRSLIATHHVHLVHDSATGRWNYECDQGDGRQGFPNPELAGAAARRHADWVEVDAAIRPVVSH